MFDGVLEGSHAVVTAAGQGIGWATAVGLADAGAAVTICDISQDALDRAAARDGRIVGLVADVSDPDQVDGFFAQAVERSGPVDILVNNVGVSGPTGLVEEHEPAEWDRTIAVNLNAHFYCCRAVIGSMKSAGRGLIVNISSVAGKVGYPYHAAYAVSKAAVIALTNTLAMELGPHNVRANTICPCAVAGPRIDSVIETEAEMRGMPVGEVREIYLSQNSMHTFIAAEDIANMVTYLASPAGAKISGQTIAVDGNIETLRPS